MGSPGDAPRRPALPVRDLAAAAFQGAPTATAVVDVRAEEARLLHANDAWCRLTGYEPEQIADLLLGAVIEGFGALRPLVAQRRSVRDVQAECVCADGRRVPVVVHATGLEADAGMGSLVLVQAHAATSPLFASHGSTERRLQDLLDNVGVMFFVKRAGGRYLMSNLHFARQLAIPRDEVRGKTDFDLFPPDMAAKYTENDRQVLAAGMSMAFDEPWEGGGAWLSVKFPLFDEDGKAYAVAGISADISDHNRAKEEAERASRAKSDFLSRMSHELRTPLNSILGFGQLLQMERLPGDAAENVDQVVKGGRHLLALINEVLEITQIEAGAHRMSLEPVHACEPLGDALELVRPLAAECGIELVRDLHAGLYRYVMADRQRLMQVLLNLLANAVKYNRAGGTVTATFAVVGDDRLRFRIADTGHGIDEADLDKIFLPFERLAAARAGAEGTGLGLTLSRRLVEAMAGAIGVERTAKGEGTVFFVELPLTETPVGAGVLRADDAMLQLQSGDMPDATVVYVEDNVANVDLLKRVLARVGKVVLVPAMQGRLGIELATQHQPDLILLDLHLPDLDGEEVLRRLRRDGRTAHIPVIVLSADATASRRERLYAKGADEYLTKPLDLPVFVDTVRRLLTRSAA